MKKLLSVLMVLTLVFGLYQNVFAIEGHTCIFPSVTITHEQLYSDQQSINDFEQPLIHDADSGYSAAIMQESLTDPNYLYGENAYLDVEQSGSHVTIHYLRPYIVKDSEGNDINYELKNFYYKASTYLFIFNIDKPLQVGQCVSFDIVQSSDEKYHNISHIYTVNAGFVPPVKVYSIITGYKYDYNNSDIENGVNIPFTDKVFTFKIFNSSNEVIATAKSTPTGELVFTYGSHVDVNELKLLSGVYTVVEDPYVGYEVAMTRLVSNTGITDGTVNSIILDTDTMSDFTFTFYNKKSITYTNETAWAVLVDQNTGKPAETGCYSLNKLFGVKSNKWGWYLDAKVGTYDVYAGAGQNDLTKGTKIATVTVSIVNNKYTAEYTLIGDNKISSMQLGVYADLKSLTATGGAPGKFTNLVNADKAKYILIHFDSQVAHY